MRRLLDDAIYQVWKLWALYFSLSSVQTRRFLKIAFWKPILTPWLTYATNWNNLNNCCREPLKDHSCEVWSKSNERFKRWRCLSTKFTHDGRRTPHDDGRRTKTGHNSSPCTLCSGWAKQAMQSLLIILLCNELLNEMYLPTKFLSIPLVISQLYLSHNNWNCKPIEILNHNDM